MAGILNNKERIMDTLVTSLGREQAANGVLRVRYASFTDYHTFYRASGSNNVADDHTSRIYFETFSREQDLIIPELDLGSAISRPFKAGDFTLDGETLASGTFRRGVSLYDEILSGSALPAMASAALNEITDNFRDLKILGTKDTFSDTTGFSFNETTITFPYRGSPGWLLSPEDIANGLLDRSTRFNDSASSHISVDAAPSLFMDEKLAHLPNFKYLPPVNTPDAFSPIPQPIGKYAKITRDAPLTYNEIIARLHELNRKPQVLSFHETSADNNFFAQVFEVNLTDDTFKKLDIIDIGEFETPMDEFSRSKHVFFVGKIIDNAQLPANMALKHGIRKLAGPLADANPMSHISDSQTFFNIFTVVIE